MADKPLCVHHFDIAERALKHKAYDEAIEAYDAALTLDPYPEMKIFGYWDLFRAITLKFGFDERDDASLNDYEIAWSLRRQACLNHLIDFYDTEHHLYSPEATDLLEQIYRDASDEQSYGMTYGLMVYDRHGQKQPRESASFSRVQLPPLRSVDNVKSPKSGYSPSDYKGGRLVTQRAMGTAAFATAFKFAPVGAILGAVIGVCGGIMTAGEQLSKTRAQDQTFGDIFAGPVSGTIVGGLIGGGIFGLIGVLLGLAKR